MPTTLLKRSFLFFSILIVASLACDVSVTVNPPTNPAPLPTNSAVPTTIVPTQTAASPTGIPATLPAAATASWTL